MKQLVTFKISDDDKIKIMKDYGVAYEHSI